MIRVGVRVENIEGLDAQYEEVVQAIEENLDEVATFVESEAQNASVFKDKNGDLRRSIRKRKSKFKNGGFIIIAGGSKAPHAHLVEYGHVMLNKFGEPTKLGRVPAKSFMRTAAEKGIRKAVELLRVKK